MFSWSAFRPGQLLGHASQMMFMGNSTIDKMEKRIEVVCTEES